MVRSIPFRNSENSYSYFRKKLCLMILYESELLFYLDIIVNLKTRIKINDDFTEESGEDKCGILELPTATGGSQRVLKFSSPDDSPPILVMTV